MNNSTSYINSTLTSFLSEFVGSAYIGGWGEEQLVLTVVDTLITSFVYWRVGGKAIQLLLILSLLKFTNLIWLCLALDYSESYTRSLCTTITVGLEIGWLINDHIASVSTLQKLLVIPQSCPKRIFAAALTFISITFGIFLRVVRTSCAFGDCIALENDQRASLIDSLIAINVITTEFILLGMLLYFFYSLYRKGPSRSAVVKEMINQGLLRVLVLVPFGILEISAYALQKRTARSVNGLLEIGIYARHLYPSLLAITISLSRIKMSFTCEEVQIKINEV